MTLVEIIKEEMFNDDEDQSDRILQQYEVADQAGKDIIDELLISLCGWSMVSLKAKLED